MTAYINGVLVTGTPQEIATLIATMNRTTVITTHTDHYPDFATRKKRTSLRSRLDSTKAAEGA